MQIHQNTRKKHPKLSMQPFRNERELLLRQAMQLIHSQTGMLPKLHMRLTQLKRAAAKTCHRRQTTDFIVGTI